jgi:predicted ATPase
MDAIIRSPELQGHAEELLVLSAEHGFSLFSGRAIACSGRSLAELGQAREGLGLLTQGLAAIRATGAVANTPRLLIWIADAHAMLGEPDEALNCLAETAQIIATTEERADEAELYRLRGDLLRARVDRAAAERSYHQALAIAVRQNAKLFEPRAAMSMARLWRDQRKVQQARELLAPVYGWFTEGFDTLDLKQAKALLDELV